MPDIDEAAAVLFEQIVGSTEITDEEGQTWLACSEEHLEADPELWLLTGKYSAVTRIWNHLYDLAGADQRALVWDRSWPGHFDGHYAAVKDHAVESIRERIARARKR